MKPRSIILWLVCCGLSYALMMGGIIAALEFLGATDGVVRWISVIGGLTLFASFYVTGVLLPPRLKAGLDERGNSALFWGGATFVSVLASLFTVGLHDIVALGLIGGALSLAMFYGSQLTRST